MTESPVCMCTSYRGGYTCIDPELNLWGCAACREPTQRYLDGIYASMMEES